MKKLGFGVGKWNGVGGKKDPGESIEACAKRKTKNEIHVTPNELLEVGNIEFSFPHRAEWNQRVHIFFCASWLGDPRESEQMRPEWFATDNLPSTDRWSSDAHWFTEAIKGKQVYGSIVFREDTSVIDKNLTFTQKIPT